MIQQFLSTLSLRRATAQKRAYSAAHKISIHALLAESDCPNARYDKARIAFLSTLSLRRATPAAVYPCHPYAFLSTLSLRRATGGLIGGLTIGLDFYPRSPCGERPTVHTHRPRQGNYFYPRSPCGERPGARYTNSSFKGFLSTLSLRRATVRR